jgi:hypothetical protein
LRLAKAAETSAQNNWELDMRRAQGLYMLHQAVLEKEVNGVDSTATSAPAPAIGPSTIDGIRVNRKSKHVLNDASAELQRLRQLPPGSHKWTWGAELSVAEVRQVVPPPGPLPHQHSRYRRTLPDGRFRKYFSPSPVPPSATSAMFSSVAADVMSIPPMPDSHNSVDYIAIANDEIPTRHQHPTDPPIADIPDAASPSNAGCNTSRRGSDHASIPVVTCGSIRVDDEAAVVKGNNESNASADIDNAVVSSPILNPDHPAVDIAVDANDTAIYIDPYSDYTSIDADHCRY